MKSRGPRGSHRNPPAERQYFDYEDYQRNGYQRTQQPQSRAEDNQLWLVGEVHQYQKDQGLRTKDVGVGTTDEVNRKMFNTAKIGCSINRKIVQVAMAEVLGTATLIYLGVMKCDSKFSFGLSLVLSAHTFGHISGAHYNPAVSIGATIMGKIHWKLLPVYVVSQFVGSFLGYAFFYLTFLLEKSVDEQVEQCCPTTIKQGTIMQGFAIELIATAMLVLFCCSCWDEKNSTNNGANCIKVGLGLAGLVHAASDITGASFNIARTLPATLITNDWTGHWVYWVAPNLGGVLGAMIYKFTLMKRTWQDEENEIALQRDSKL